MSGAEVPAALARLARGEPVSATDAVAALEAVAGTLAEGRALDALLVAAERGPLPAPVALAGARLAALRGEHTPGLTLLAGQGSAEAARLRAELGATDDGSRRAPAAAGAAPRSLGASPLVLPPPSTRFPALRVGAELGRGGAATVYAAEDIALGRTVALKLYHRARAHREQLMREARLAVAVAGPGVVPVLDLDPEHGVLVLALAEQGSLARLFRAAPTPEAPLAGDGVGAGHGPPPGGAPSPDALALTVPRWLPRLVATLERVHAAGLVHGDLKPSNVLLHREGPWLGDFGVATPVGAPRRGGTAGYLRPTPGAAAQPADDWYALGRVLAELAEALARAGSRAGPRWSEAATALCAVPEAATARRLASGPAP